MKYPQKIVWNVHCTRTLRPCAILPSYRECGHHTKPLPLKPLSGSCQNHPIPVVPQLAKSSTGSLIHSRTRDYLLSATIFLWKLPAAIEMVVGLNGILMQQPCLVKPYLRHQITLNQKCQASNNKLLRGVQMNRYLSRMVGSSLNYM
jgi:hypothetical protein